MIDIAAIRASVDLVALVGARVRLTRRGRESVGRCLFHDEKTPSFRVNERRWHCFGCGAHGDALDFVMRAENLTLIEAAKRLGFGGELDRETRQRLAAEQRERDAERERERRREAALTAWRDRNPDCCLPDWAVAT